MVSTWDEFFNNVKTGWVDPLLNWYTKPGTVAEEATIVGTDAAKETVGNVTSGVFKIASPLIIPALLLVGAYILILFLERRK